MNAYWFVDFLVSCGMTIWQTLPIVPPDEQLSPYQSPSAHAGNIRLICLHQLEQAGWLSPDPEAPADEDVALAVLDKYREQRLHQAHTWFQQQAPAHDREAYQQFLQDNLSWLEDYAFFKVFKREYDDAPWWEWKLAYRDRHASSLKNARKRFAEALDYYQFQQFLFFRQWSALKQYANQRGVLLFGDLPIFVSADSVEVWANQKNFQLDEAGRPKVVAGVPPDCFSATGQLWGNPHYNWAYMEKNNFQWWLDRLHTQHKLFDMVRIDHFRGFEAYWEVPADADTAIHGRWVKAPGEALFDTLEKASPVPLVAEDLGFITPEVLALREKYDIPGMKVLQFAFDGSHDNPYLPHFHSPNYVIYTATHDNDTTLGWFELLSTEQQAYVCDYLAADPDDMPWPMIRAALMSPARLAIIPMQDALALDSAHRMNLPGQSGGDNWRWRFTWDQVPENLHHEIRHMLELYGRL